MPLSGVMTKLHIENNKNKKCDNTFAAYRQNIVCCETIITFLPERTDGRAYATVLRLSVTYVLWLNGASWGKSYY